MQETLLNVELSRGELEHWAVTSDRGVPRKVFLPTGFLPSIRCRTASKPQRITVLWRWVKI